MWHLIVEAKGSFWGELAAFFYVGSNMWCYGFSALFHVGTWSVKTEIMLQKLDHCGIAILSCGTFLPVSLLLFAPRVGNMLIWLSCSACIWACWNIMNLRLSIIRLVIVPSCFIPFLPFFLNECNWISRNNLHDVAASNWLNHFQLEEARSLATNFWISWIMRSFIYSWSVLESAPI